MRDCDLINAFADFIRYGKHRAERTIINYRSDLEQLANFLASEKSRQCQPDDVSVLQNVSADNVRAFMSYLQNKNYSQASIRRKQAALICFYNFLCSQHLSDVNPTIGIETPRVEKRKPRILTEEQVRRLLHFPQPVNWLGARDQAMLEMLCNTGIRVSELVNLDIENIDFDRQSLQITGGSGKQRHLRLLPTVIEIIRDYLQLRQKKVGLYGEPGRAALFVNKFGRRLDTRSADRRIEKYTMRAGMGDSITPYDLRHSFAQRLIANGAGAEQLYQLLGFESISAARLYVESLTSADWSSQEGKPELITANLEPDYEGRTLQ